MEQPLTLTEVYQVIFFLKKNRTIIKNITNKFSGIRLCYFYYFICTFLIKKIYYKTNCKSHILTLSNVSFLALKLYYKNYNKHSKPFD